MDFADLIDVQTTIREFKEGWKLRFTPNDLKFWAPRLESEYPTEQICASMLLEAWGCDYVFSQYENWLLLRTNQDNLHDQYVQVLKDEHDDDYYQSDMLWDKYMQSQLTWFEYWSKRNNIVHEAEILL